MNYTPDLTDAATVGAALGILRRLYDDPYLRLRHSRSRRCWDALDAWQKRIASGEDEGEALAGAAEEWRERQE